VPIEALVNIEALRKQQPNEGLNHSLDFSTEALSGNSDYFGIKTGYRLDYHRNGQDFLVVAHYQQASSSGEEIQNKHFVHVRNSKALTDRSKRELFIQQSENSFINLQKRLLLGITYRRSLIQSTTFQCDISTGLMHEEERLVNDTSSQLLRSSNYLVLNHVTQRGIQFNSVSYAQFALSDVSDYRVLSDISAIVPITSQLDLKNTLSYRYDSNAADDIKHYDIEFSQGIVFHF